MWLPVGIFVRPDHADDRTAQARVGIRPTRRECLIVRFPHKWRLHALARDPRLGDDIEASLGRAATEEPALPYDPPAFLGDSIACGIGVNFENIAKIATEHGLPTLFGVNQVADCSLSKPDRKLLNQMEDAIFDQTELKEIFVLIPLDQARPGCRGEGHEMGKVSRKIFAQVEARRLPRIGRRKNEYNGLAGPDAARADAVRFHIERHLDIHVQPDARPAAFRLKHRTAGTLGMGLRDA